MDSFFTSSNNFTLDEDSSDNLSMKMNRSRMLLSEMGQDHDTSRVLSSTTRTSNLFRKSLISTESPLFNRQQNRTLLNVSQQHALSTTISESNGIIYRNTSWICLGTVYF